MTKLVQIFFYEHLISRFCKVDERGYGKCEGSQHRIVSNSIMIDTGENLRYCHLSTTTSNWHILSLNDRKKPYFEMILAKKDYDLNPCCSLWDPLINSNSNDWRMIVSTVAWKINWPTQYRIHATYDMIGHKKSTEAALTKPRPHRSPTRRV